MERLVTIIMPSYNTAKYIKDSIQSVINQTYTNWELIIVDDCSTDNSDEIIRSIRDDRIRYFRNETNQGAALSRNKALREAKGRWIAFLDSDDLWLPEKLEKQISFMERKGYSFSYTEYEEIDSDGKRTGIRVTGPKRITQAGMYNYCWPGCLTVMYDRKVVGDIQIADIRKNNDYAMWLKVCKRADCFLVNECLAKYRRGRSGSISTHGNLALIKWHFKMFKESEKIGTLESLFYTGRNIVFGTAKRLFYVIRE